MGKGVETVFAPDEKGVRKKDWGGGPPLKRSL